MHRSCCPSKMYGGSLSLRQCTDCAQERLKFLAKASSLAPKLESENMAQRIRPNCHSVPMLKALDAYPLNPQIPLEWHINAAESDHRKATGPPAISKYQKSTGLITIYEADDDNNTPSITLSSAKKSSTMPKMDMKSWHALDFPQGDIAIDYTVDPKHRNDEKISKTLAKKVKIANLEFELAMMSVLADYSWINEMKR